VVYLNYLMRALPAIAGRVSSNPDAYVYLAESIRAWPDQRALAELIAGAGWDDVAWRNVTGGIVALHRAVKP
jgi:demethylmenaquinone methyltransferase/2-methoxy-6-polyprenyl-1,4-benzoquinol methylase